MDRNEKARLEATWRAHPKVAKLHEDTKAFALREHLAFDTAGLRAIARFADTWFAEHGPLPDSEIRAG